MSKNIRYSISKRARINKPFASQFLNRPIQRLNYSLSSLYINITCGHNRILLTLIYLKASSN
nr:MAG TPA: hypothetical protein [Bacteriophage sp.]